VATAVMLPPPVDPPPARPPAIPSAQRSGGPHADDATAPGYPLRPTAGRADGESLGQLAGVVAHDVNNLLTVIRNYAAFVADALDAAAAGEAAGAAPGQAAEAASAAAARWETMRRDVAQIQRASERAAELTGQLLAAAGRPHPAPVAATSLNTVVAETVAMLRRLLGDRIEARVELDDALWPVRVPPARLEQALVNLAMNARDAMPAGGTLTVITGNVLLGGQRAGAAGGTPDLAHLAFDPLAAGAASRPRRRYVGLWVIDTGVGMPPETQARVFEPYFTTKPPGRGTGLGMTVVRDVAAQAGGDVRISSTLGAGTTVRMLFPADPIEPPGHV
jgi:signal transduction histidine kinase